MATAKMAEAANGIGRIAAAFDAARDEGRAALMPYMMGGFPDLETSAALIDAYADTGADLIELGVPYSDPLADGPVIHAAATEALAAGTRFGDVMTLCERVSARVPVLPMVYVNVVLTLGPDRFAATLERAGAAGAIIPDLPPGEDDSIAEALIERGLAPIGFVAPTTAPERLRAIAAAATGFTYVVSLTGVTGERAEVPPELAALVGAVRGLARSGRGRVRNRHAGARRDGRGDGRRGHHRNPAGPGGRRCRWKGGGGRRGQVVPRRHARGARGRG